MQAPQIPVSLTLADIQNVINLLNRSKFEGLEEAEVAVVLAHKLKVAVATQQQTDNETAINAEIAKRQPIVPVTDPAE